MPRILSFVPLLLLLASCRPYADFRLPDPGRGEAGRYVWRESSQPVLPRGRAGEWDSVDTLNPSVVDDGQKLWNFYSGFDGHTWHTGVAVALRHSGAAWTRAGRIFSPNPESWEGSYIAANGAAVRFNGTFLYWYQAGDPPRIGLARSTDGRHWTRETAPVLATGPRGAWDENATADPYALVLDQRIYLYYLGEDRARRQRLGVAVSEDGVHFIKLRTSPILELGDNFAFDENGLGEPAVWQAHGRYWMLYTGRDRKEWRRLGLAVSSDGARWERTGQVFSGASPWDEKVICDPAVLVEGRKVRVWFGGGNIAHPAENINGQIGYGELEYLP